MKSPGRSWRVLCLWLCVPWWLSCGQVPPDCPDRYACLSCPTGEDCSLPGVALVFHAGPDRPGFFSAPWPADPRATAAGRPDLTGFPNPAGSSMLRTYLETMAETTRGFGNSAAVYFTFDGALDPARLPASPEQSLAADARAFLVGISAGPDRARRIPVAVRWLAGERQFTPAHTLVMRPLAGFPLRPDTRYAAVVLRSVNDGSGHPLGSPSALERTKSSRRPDDSGQAAWWEALQPVYALLEEQGVARIDLAACTVFTTSDPIAQQHGLVTWLAGQAASALAGFRRLPDKTDLFQFEATLDLPEFQAGTPPYFSDGGAFVFDADGQPLVQRKPTVPVILAVPKGEPPQAGWPVVLYAHGTGGDRTSFIDATDDVADKLARRGLASVSLDQPLHGARNPTGADPNYTTFNPTNILAIRDNLRQGALDLSVLARALQTAVIPADVSPTASAIALDGGRLALMGHSQGSLTGVPFAALSGIRGGVFSGSGGGLAVAILDKTEPVDIRAMLVQGLLLEDDEFDLDHPVLNLFQAFAEPADPQNYARLLFREPVDGQGVRHLYFSQGLLDRYALPSQVAALAAEAGAAPMAPFQGDWPPFDLRGITPAAPPVSGNAQGPDGAPVTAVLVQYPDDGHFAVFDNPDAERHYLDFLDDLLHDRLPAVGP